MTHSTAQNNQIVRDLGGGLVLRRATVADTEELVAFNARIHANPDENEVDEGVGIWTRDLMTRAHPTFDVQDFTIVEDTATGRIVSSLNLISQTWSYDGVSFGVGRPELVGTEPAYRHRGLVRQQFEVIHEWSAQRGHLVQGITGIPYYYRLFGYEMALGLGGRRAGYQQHVPKLSKDKQEPYPIRAAREEDLPFMAALYEQANERQLVTCVRDEALWRYELSGQTLGSITYRQLCIIESQAGEPVGFLAHPCQLWGPQLAAVQYELKPGVSWLAVTPGVIRYLWQRGQDYATQEKKKAGLGAFCFSLGLEHPVYEAAHHRLPYTKAPYAWFIRVPEWLAFLQHITPVLEERLANSIAAGHTGQLKISFYRHGLRFVFQKGRLLIEPWQPTASDEGHAAFSNLTFLQLLFGYRSLAELNTAFADCWTQGDNARVLLNVLFPKKPSNPWPL